MKKKRRIFYIIVTFVLCALIYAALYKHQQPIRCESHYILKINENISRKTIISDGTMLMTFFNDNSGVGVYMGKITYENSDTPSVYKIVNKTFKFSYSVKYDQITLKTGIIITNMGNTASDEEIKKYLYQVLQKGKITHGTLLKIDGVYAVGENLNPESICHNVDID